MQRAGAGEDFYAFESFSQQLEGTYGIFRVAELVSVGYLSIRMHAHALERTFTHFKDFHDNGRVSKGCSEL